MKIGIWINSDYQPSEGGGFSYYDRLVHALDEKEWGDNIELCYVTRGTREMTMRHPVIHLHTSTKVTIGERILRRLPLVGWHYQDMVRRRIDAEKNCQEISQLEQAGVKLIMYLTSGCELNNFPFIATHWDIGHLSTYAFPELAMNGQFENRYHYYSQVLPKALMIFVESEAGKAELLRYTPIADSKIRVVPIFAGNCVNAVLPEPQQQDVLRGYGLDRNQYFFYPAQFWAHKNHVTLLKAFARFIAVHPSYKLVLTGTDHGNLGYIQSVVSELGIKDKVVFPGFVPIEHINTFYQNASSLIMASFFGPTNMPPLEAIELGCPVIASNVSGHREQLGEAALYFDATDVDGLLSAMEKMVDNTEMKQRIQERKLTNHFTIKEAIRRIETYLGEVILIRESWK